MRPNDGYIYLGYAARMASALGINRAQVVEGCSMPMHRLRVTFWTLYSYERASALYTGRPSTFRDDLIDAPYPSDLTTLDSSADSDGSQHLEAVSHCAFIRALTHIGRVSDRVLVDIYSTSSNSNLLDIIKVHQLTVECDLDLESMTYTIPSYLHFFDANLAIGSGWKEVQRLYLGVNYYLVRMLMYRPALVFSTFFNSEAEAEESLDGIMHIRESIEASITSAKNIINLVHEVYFKRYTQARFDGNLATFLASACITLLYSVLDSNSGLDYACDIFAVVERGIECLDQVQHIGPTSGKFMSLDIMKVAKDALLSVQARMSSAEDLNGAFPRLQYVFFALFFRLHTKLPLYSLTACRKKRLLWRCPLCRALSL